MSSRTPVVGLGGAVAVPDSVARPSLSGPWLVRWDTVQDERPQIIRRQDRDAGSVTVIQSESGCTVLFDGYLGDGAEPGEGASRSNAARVAAAYERSQEGVFDRLRGGFTLAVWDQDRRRLLAGRDAMGLHPCFYWWNGRLLLLSEKWVSAVNNERERAIKFINALEIKTGTDVHAALMRALDFSGGNWNTSPREDSIDTIFMLSDGMPSVGSVPRSEIADRILDAARFKRIAITTVALAAPEDGRELLKRISDGTGGLHVLR